MEVWALPTSRLHYWFKRIGLNRQILGAPEIVREEAAELQGFNQ